MRIQIIGRKHQLQKWSITKPFFNWSIKLPKGVTIDTDNEVKEIKHESEKKFLQKLINYLEKANFDASDAMFDAGGYDDGGEGMDSYEDSIADIESKIKSRMENLK